MSSPLLTDVVVLDQGAEGNLKRLEEQLMLLWAQGDTDETKPSLVHACMGNLIVYLEREDDRNDILEIVGEVVRARPSRVILMFAYPDLPDSPIEVSVSAQCWLEGHGKEQVCSEQIRIRATGSKINELPGIVASLLVSDVPVHLWWRDRFLDRQELFHQFVPHIDHVIFEGLHWKNLIEKVEKVAGLLMFLEGQVAITNFNWSRLQPWQQRIAQFFDRGLYEGELEHLCRLSVEFHTPPSQQDGRFFQALLLCGWLAGQLNWKLQSGTRKGTGTYFRFTRRDDMLVEVAIDHEVIPSPGTKGIQELKFGFDHAGKKSELAIDRDPENQLLFMVVKKEGAPGLPQKVRHVSASLATLLLRGMENYQSSRVVFERAFANAVDMLKAVS